MWINENTGKEFAQEIEVRLELGDTSLCTNADDAEFARFGYIRIREVPQPAFDPITQTVRRLPAVKVGDHYEQAYEIVELDAATIAVNRRNEVEYNNYRIKTEIAALDLRRIRPLAEGDMAFLADLNAQIVALRAQLA